MTNCLTIYLSRTRKMKYIQAFFLFIFSSFATQASATNSFADHHNRNLPDTLLPCQKKFISFGFTQRFHPAAQIDVLSGHMPTASYAYPSTGYFLQYTHVNPRGLDWQIGAKLIYSPFGITLNFATKGDDAKPFVYDYFDLNNAYLTPYLGISDQWRINRKWSFFAQASFGVGYQIAPLWRENEVNYNGSQIGKKIANIEHHTVRWNPDLECIAGIWRTFQTYQIGLELGAQSFLFNPIYDRITTTLATKGDLTVSTARASFPFQVSIRRNLCPRKK